MRRYRFINMPPASAVLTLPSSPCRHPRLRSTFRGRSRWPPPFWPQQLPPHPGTEADAGLTSVPTHPDDALEPGWEDNWDAAGDQQLGVAAHAGVPRVSLLQGGGGCGGPSGSSCQERSCSEGGRCCCCYLLDKDEPIQKPNKLSWNLAQGLKTS